MNQEPDGFSHKRRHMVLRENILGKVDVFRCLELRSAVFDNGEIKEQRLSGRVKLIFQTARDVPCLYNVWYNGYIFLASSEFFFILEKDCCYRDVSSIVRYQRVIS